MVALFCNAVSRAKMHLLVLTLVVLNIQFSHAHCCLSANQVAWRNLFLQIHGLGVRVATDQMAAI